MSLTMSTYVEMSPCEAKEQNSSICKPQGSEREIHQHTSTCVKIVNRVKEACELTGGSEA